MLNWKLYNSFNEEIREGGGDTLAPQFINRRQIESIVCEKLVGIKLSKRLDKDYNKIVMSRASIISSRFKNPRDEKRTKANHS